MPSKIVWFQKTDNSDYLGEIRNLFSIEATPATLLWVTHRIVAVESHHSGYVTHFASLNPNIWTLNSGSELTSS